MKTIIVEVKQKHIRTGKIGAASSCPIALALKDAGCAVSCVGQSEIRFQTPSGIHICIDSPSRIAQQFIARFDGDKPVKPFVFEIPL